METLCKGTHIVDLETVGKIFGVLLDQGVLGTVSAISLWFAWHKDKQLVALNAKVVELLLAVNSTIQLNKEETEKDDRSKIENHRGGNLLLGGSDDPEDQAVEPKVSDSQKIRKFPRGNG